ncbi:MAG: hypothetical protein NVSMB13_12880 [Mycobacteriales bacterium]
MSVAISVVYTFLLGWGFSVGARQVYQGFKRPNELLNPLFSNPVAIRLFTLHIIVVSADLFVIGPWAVTHKSTLWYWGGRIALLSSSLPIAAYMNRNPQSFGKFIGRWVTFRNLFEYTSHVVVAAMVVNWFHYYILLWWLVAYRYLDVGPRRALQKLYNTPEKKAARPWAPGLNWAVIASIYVLAFLAVYNRQVLYAKVPADSVVPHVPASWEVAVVVGFNLVLALGVWIGIRKYTDSLTSRSQPAETAVVGAH